jgi:hypothetical protein
MEAIFPEVKLSTQELKRAQELLDPVNLELVTIATQSGRKVKILKSIKPLKSDGDLLETVEMRISIGDNRLRKIQIDALAPETMRIEGRVTLDFYAYDRHMVISPPHLSKLAAGNTGGKVVFYYEPCIQDTNASCAENEFVITWNMENIKNVAGVILTREDETNPRRIRLPTAGHLKGSLSEKICATTTYRIVGINSMGRYIQKTADEFQITQSNVLPCNKP